MTYQTAKDGRPDVQVKATVKVPRHIDPNSDVDFMIFDVRFEVHCRFCVETLMTNDMLDAVRKAEGHENSQSHIYAKQEYQNVPVAPLETSGDWAGQSRPMMDAKVSWGPDAHSIDQVLGSDGADLPYPPNHPRGQHGIETLANVEARMQELRNQDPDQMC